MALTAFDILSANTRIIVQKARRDGAKPGCADMLYVFLEKQCGNPVTGQAR